MNKNSVYTELMQWKVSPFWKPMSYMICIVILVSLSVLCIPVFLTIHINESMPNEPIFIILFSVLILIITLWMFWKFALRIEVNKDDIRYKASPIVNTWKIIPYHHIESLAIKQYDPRTTLLGYGIKYNFFTVSWGYTISGDFDLFIRKKNGKLILLDTWQPKELKNALKEVAKDKLI